MTPPPRRRIRRPERMGRRANPLHALILLLPPFFFHVPAQASTGGVDQTFGSDSYRGTRARLSIDLNDRVYVSPSLGFYRSDSSQGTRKTLSLRLGYDSRPWDLGFSMGISPKTSGYRNTSAGIDAAYTVRAGGSTARDGNRGDYADPEIFRFGLEEVEIGGGLTRINHRDDLQLAPGAAGAAPGPKRTRGRAASLPIAQTDLTASLQALFHPGELGMQMTKSSYDKDLAAMNARGAQITELRGVLSLLQGFPDASLNLNAGWTAWPKLTPSFSYTHTTFKLGDPPSSSYAVSLRLASGGIRLKTACERYVQNGGVGRRNYFTLGADLPF